ncbi:MAG: HD domain-containing protein [Bacteroidota bacterium]
MADFKKLQSYVLTRLEAELDPNLSYHSVEHTIDVLEAAARIAQREQRTDEEIELVKTAAVLHDAGFLIQYFNNEPVACELAAKWLPQFNYTPEEIDAVQVMIMATRIPQTPQSELARIIADADLDYLGRNDFFTIGQRLYREFLRHGVVDGEQSWNRLQVSFLESHDYFTDTALDTRSAVKMHHLQELKNLVNSYI